MRQVSIRQLRREVSVQKLREWTPCEIVADGQVVAHLTKMAEDAETIKVTITDIEAFKKG